MNNVIPFTYQGQPVRFTADGWLNATKIAIERGRQLLQMTLGLDDQHTNLKQAL